MVFLKRTDVVRWERVADIKVLGCPSRKVKNETSFSVQFSAYLAFLYYSWRYQAAVLSADLKPEGYKILVSLSISDRGCGGH